jgi:[ribosomal protein S18]-alanine N-acetyltransferase
MDKLWMAPLGLHIEPAIADDADDLARLHAAGFYRGWPREDFVGYLSESNSPTYVITDGARRKIAGFAMLRLAGDEAELITIAIDPKVRGRGMGDALMRAMFDDLLRSSARRMLLEVAEDNPAALALYRKHGFREIGRRAGYYARANGVPATALVMARDLG